MSITLGIETTAIRNCLIDCRSRVYCVIAINAGYHPITGFDARIEWYIGKKEITPNVHCKLFEDNNGALELAKAPRYRPRTKHIAVKYHHFRE